MSTVSTSYPGQLPVGGDSRQSLLVQLVRYALVAVVALATDAGLLFLLTQYLHVHYLVAAAAGFVAGLGVNYLLSVLWVFRTRVYQNRLAEFALFAGIGMIGLAMNEAGMFVLAGKFHLHVMLAKAITAGAVFGWNFGARRLALFSGAGIRSLAVPSAVVVALATTVFVAASAGIAYTRVPFVDEGNFAVSALNILRTGHTGVPTVPPWGMGIPLPQSQTYNFWIMPSYPYLLSAWFRVLPQDLHSARVLSIGFGLASILLLYALVRKMTGDRRLALLALVLLATDFNLTHRSAMARMDTMTLAINVSSWLVFLGLRERSAALALGAACFLAAAGLTVHPNAIFGFVGIALLWFFYDRRISLDRIAAAAAGSIVPLLALIPWAMQQPDIWRVQVANHSVGRFIAFLHPLKALKKELEMRYLAAFGFALPVHYDGRLVLLLVLVVYLAAFGMALARFRTAPVFTRFLTILTGFIMVYFAFFEAGHFLPYTAQLIPLFCLLLAVAVRHSESALTRRIALAATCFVVLVNLGATAAYIRSDRYHNTYAPVLAAMQSNLGPQDRILSHSYFAIPLGFNRVIEDYTLVSVLRDHPKFVTLNQHFRTDSSVKTWVNGPDPETAGMIAPGERQLAARYFQDHYRLVLKNPDYELYERQ